MTSHQASYQHRGRFLAKKVTAYVESRDQIICKDHGPENYDLVFLDSGWVKVCHRCFEMVVPDAKEAVALPRNGPFVCSERSCLNDAEKGCYCAWCKGSFCKGCMFDAHLCNTCNTEIETKEVTNDPRAAFHAC